MHQSEANYSKCFQLSSTERVHVLFDLNLDMRKRVQLLAFLPRNATYILKFPKMKTS